MGAWLDASRALVAAVTANPVTPHVVLPYSKESLKATMQASNSAMKAAKAAKEALLEAQDEANNAQEVAPAKPAGQKKAAEGGAEPAPKRTRKSVKSKDV